VRSELPIEVAASGIHCHERIRTASEDSRQETWLILPSSGPQRLTNYPLEMDSYALLVALDGLFRAQEDKPTPSRGGWP
jgi:hypothetical protein